MCIFCDEKNEAFDEDGLDNHYYNECPMLAKCPFCRSVRLIFEI
jgi:centrosomal protein CEP104